MGSKKNGTNRISASALGESRFEHGPFHYGEGCSIISDEIVHRIFTFGLTPAQMLLLLVLNREAWLHKDLIVRASASFLWGKTRMGPRTIERHLSDQGNLRRRGFVHLHISDHDKGNVYFVEPVLIWSSKWTELKSFDLSRFFNCDLDGLRQAYIDAMSPTASSAKMAAPRGRTAKMAEQYRRNGGTKKSSSCVKYRQNGGQITSDLFRSIDAPHHSLPTEPAGGVGGNQSPPVPPKKGVGLSADAIAEEAFQTWKKLDPKSRPPWLEFVESFKKGQEGVGLTADSIEHRKKPVGTGGSATSMPR